MLLRYTAPLMHGEEVSRLQARLSALGLLGGKIDGFFGRETARAVRAFQSQAGLSIDGIVGPQTRRLIFAEEASALDPMMSRVVVGAPRACVDVRALRYAMPLMRGDDVVAVQRRLKEMGYLSGAVDGIFGPGTARAVRAFQTNQGLPQDGIVAGETQTRLLAEMSVPRRAEQHVAPTASTTAHPSVDLDVLAKPHRRFEGSCSWQLTPSGVSIDGCPARGSGGDPRTVRHIWQKYQDSIERWASHYGVPAELIIATIATESSGNAKAARREPGYKSDRETPHRVSYGLMQTLISTARAALGDDKIDADFLLKPDGSIRAGTAYIAQQARKTQFDPPVVACAYNAGSVVRNDGRDNHWRMRQFPIGTSRHADRWVGFFNDCHKVLATQPPQAPSMFAMLNLSRA
jgi:peptidoglycan hydrolase-like protein with peptidoglycan-binding domain